MDVAVGGEHCQRVLHHPHGNAVVMCQVGSGQGIAVVVLAGLDLAAQDAGEFDVLGGVVGVHVVEHGQVRDRFHWSALLGEDREHCLAGIFGFPSPAGGQGLDDEQAAPVLGAGGRCALHRRKRAGIGHSSRGSGRPLTDARGTTETRT